jgi:hypothetical protein
MAGRMSMSGLVEAGDHWDLPLNGREVTQFQIDYAVTLVLGDSSGSFYVTIEQPFSMRLSRGAEEVVIVPEAAPAAMGRALALLRETVQRAVAYKDGRLELDFTGGARVLVPVADKFEAWNIVGPDGLRLVSLPGGELAVWKPESGASED